MKGDDIAERLLEFAVAFLRITPGCLPTALAGTWLAHSQFPVPSSPVGLALQLVNREQKTENGE